MKNKIQKFSKGEFQTPQSKLILEETNLVVIIGEGEVYRGSFNIRAEKGVIRGLIYASSFRVRFRDQGFEGNPVRIEYTYDGRGLRPGHVEKGRFTIVCNGGEYDIAFTAIIEKPYVLTSYGKVQSTDDFRKLAIKDFSEAVRLFRSREFYEILKYEDERIFHLYNNMRKWSLGEQAMEEFLVGIKQKECIFLTLQGEGMFFEDIQESTKGTLTLMKNTWGFMPIRVEATGDFIRISRTSISTDDFVGNVFEVEYVVLPDKLHAGRNFGQLSFVTPYETLTYQVEVLQNQVYHENHRIPELLKAQIMKEYIGYIAGRNELQRWIDSSTEKMMALRKLDPLNEIYQLMQAHIYLLGERVEDAKWILENYNYNRFAIGKDSFTNCYYLFLTALVRGEGNHVSRVIDEIGKTYTKNPDSWLLLGMLLHLDGRYKSTYKKIEILEQQFQYGNCEALFYLESYLCYKEKPTLLKKLGKFELQVLNFASKYRLLTRELALHVANFASQQKNYKEEIFRVLERIYRQFPEQMILNTICTFLMKGDKKEQRYFKWYQKAVDEKLKIARLYEYYMMTLKEDSFRAPLPKEILLYFRHGNSLDYRKAAFLYANVITYEEEAGDLYLSYREQMVAFTWNQLEKRHITDSLRVLYKRFCEEDDMTPKLMEAMRDISYSYEITAKVPGMNCVLVIEKDGNILQRVAYQEEGTVVRLYDKESRVIWESLEGRYYTDSVAYETKRLFYEPKFLEMCRRYEESLGVWQKESQKENPTLERIREKGLDAFEDQETFQLCSRKIREDNYEEDEFLTHLCFSLFQRGQYDKVTLTYLSNYYCGPTRDMKSLWRTLKEYEISAYKVGERIITQGVFSENLFQEEEIFEDYYINDMVYFRLKQAYLSYVSREYVVYERELKESIFHIIAHECEKREELPEVCKVALLKFYAGKTYSQEIERVLYPVLKEMCEKQMIFPFYFEYPEAWKREILLYDKSMIFYRGKEGSRVRLFYKRRGEGADTLGYHVEDMTPVYENIYIKKFVLFQDEAINYYIQEEEEDGKIEVTSTYILNGKKGESREGKFARLNQMSEMENAKLLFAMKKYEEEEELASLLFQKY